MLNRFICVGTLIECSIAVYQTHMRWRFSMDVNNQTIQFTQTVSRRWASKQYAAMSAMIPHLHPRIDGAVMKNGIERVYTMSANCNNTQFTRLIVTGNINMHNGKIYFNCCHVDVTSNIKDCVSIELELQWIQNDVAINVLTDFPRIFHIDKPKKCPLNKIIRITASYDSGYSCSDEILSLSDNYGLFIQSYNDTGIFINKEQMNKLLLEAEILGEKDW